MTVRDTHVLVVEDNDTLRFLVEKQLRKLQVQADFVRNGKEAIEKVRQVTYDIILMDVMMPEMDGYQATIEIREFEKLEHHRHTPIIAMTAYQDRDACLASGMDDYVFKPVLLSPLKQALSHWLTGSL